MFLAYYMYTILVVIQFIIEDNLQLQYCYTFHFLIKAIITTVEDRIRELCGRKSAT
jgi:hypothetical protein